MTERNPDDIGALWCHDGRRGEYMTGTINGLKVVVFANRDKQPGDNKPDWCVLKPRPRTERPAAIPAHNAGLVDVEDIPF